MAILAIPNISEGRDERLLARLRDAVSDSGAVLLDVHSDADHHRSVFTVTANNTNRLVTAMVELARVASAINLTSHRGVHPRLGGLDVCPFVPHEDAIGNAVAAARSAGSLIAQHTGLPVYLYGEASTRRETKELPDLRRGGLGELVDRAAAGLAPDYGPRTIDPRRGVVCVGARPALIAFNVWIRADASVARAIATEVRRPGLVRALGLPLRRGGSQVSMNLIDPDKLGIDNAFELVAEQTSARDVDVAGTELVGLVAERWMPDPQKQAARRLLAPGRSIESAIAGRKSAI